MEYSGIIVHPRAPPKVDPAKVACVQGSQRGSTTQLEKIVLLWIHDSAKVTASVPPSLVHCRGSLRLRYPTCCSDHIHQHKSPGIDQGAYVGRKAASFLRAGVLPETTLNAGWQPNPTNHS